MIINNTKYAGADWIEKTFKISKMSQLGKEVADLLGDLFFGIYHLPSVALRKVDWGNDLCIRITLSTSMATFDGDKLTRLVVLSHDRMLRVDLGPCNFQHMELLVHKRKNREGGDTYHRMPTMERHLEMIRGAYAIKPIGGKG